mgnify:CR=1 FL=1
MSAAVLDLDEIYQICEALYALTLVKKNNFGLDPVIENAKKYMDLIERLQLEERGKNGAAAE